MVVGSDQVIKKVKFEIFHRKPRWSLATYGNSKTSNSALIICWDGKFWLKKNKTKEEKTTVSIKKNLRTLFKDDT